MYVRASSARECLAFLLLAFCLTWTVWIPVLLVSRTHEQLGDLLVLGTLGPSVAAILLSYRAVRIPGSKLSSRIVCFILSLLLCWIGELMGRTPPLRRRQIAASLAIGYPGLDCLRCFSRDDGVRAAMKSLLIPRPVVWHLTALCLFPVLLVLAALVTRIHGGALPQPRVPGSSLPYALFVIAEFGYAFFVGGAVSGEPGWRGFLLPRLQDRFSPLIASLLVWFPWALWHAPLDYAGYAGPTFAAFLRTRLVILVPLSIIITWVYNRSGKTILSAALFHSVFNVAPDFIPSTEWAIWMVSVVALVVIVTDRIWQKIRKEES